MTSPATATSLSLHADLLRRLEGYGLSHAAVAWLLKSLHPAWNGESPGIPDATFQSVLRPTFVLNEVVSAPGSGPWDACIIRPPGDGTAAIVMTGPTGTDFAQFDFTAAGNGSEVLSVQPKESFGMNLFQVTTGTSGNFISYRMAQRPYRWRTDFASLTVYLTASDLYNQGTVYASSLSRPPLMTGAIQVNNMASGQIVFDCGQPDLPLDEDALLLVDPRATATPASQGVYVPSRIVGPVARMLPGYSTGSSELITTRSVPFPQTNGASAFWSAQGTNTEWCSTFVPLTTRSTNGPMGPGWRNMTELLPGGNTPVVDSGYDGMTIPIVIFRGLAEQASLTVRVIVGLEYEPAFDSPSRQYARPPPEYSPRAIEAYYHLARELRGVYPASFNSLGTLLTAIASTARTVWPFVRPLAEPLVRAAGERILRLVEQPKHGDGASVVSAAPSQRSKASAKPKAKRKPGKR